MKKIFTTLKNIFSIEELRVRILHTILLLLVFRLGSFIVLPGVSSEQLAAATQKTQKGLLGFIDTFLGGAFSKASIFALGIMPYISASIVVQLLTVAMPQFQKIQKEGESGRKKLNQITRVLTIAITMVQAIGYLTTTILPTGAVMVQNTFWFIFSSVFILTAGTIFCMWLGEKITEKGIGNGISMLIMIGIISRFPQAIVEEFLSRSKDGLLLFVLEIIVFFFVIMLVILLTQAVRHIPIQYAKQVVGNKVYRGRRQYIPLKLNASGVMPIIFAQSIMFFPALIPSLSAENDFLAAVGATFADYTSVAYNLLFAILIIVFTYIYTAITINPKQIADDMKRSNGFIPGVKPGEPTALYIDTILSRITFPGALFLALIAILPAIAIRFGIVSNFSQFYGGTSLLIMVGVIVDTLQQINSYLLKRKYDGLMETGKVKGGENIVTV
ncbi:MAG: preprotein translocase subunit SecY [Microscillaceae bacterium]|nr:preprotein translocase subunit SecY [Microscillaceae bacterium]MDW8461819.1 preprotein translocase subunit SecY [Cytophagales bacterium]